MNENVKSFLEEAAKDTALSEKIAGAETAEELLALAAEKGFTLTEEELLSALAVKNVELNDDDLDNVTGGVAMPTLKQGLIGQLLNHLIKSFGPTIVTTESRGGPSGGPVVSTMEYRTGGQQRATYRRL